jgi:hypothetical protein
VNSLFLLLASLNSYSSLTAGSCQIRIGLADLPEERIARQWRARLFDGRLLWFRFRPLQRGDGLEPLKRRWLLRIGGGERLGRER